MLKSNSKVACNDSVYRMPFLISEKTGGISKITKFLYNEFFLFRLNLLPKTLLTEIYILIKSLFFRYVDLKII